MERKMSEIQEETEEIGSLNQSRYIRRVVMQTDSHVDTENRINHTIITRS
jgi:hypothetical protein